MLDGDKFAFPDNLEQEGLTKREYAMVHFMAALISRDAHWVRTSADAHRLAEKLFPE